MRSSGPDGSATAKDLQTLPGDVLSEAFAINERGQVVGVSFGGAEGSHAFLWQNDVLLDLNDLVDIAPDVLQSAQDIDDDGRITGRVRDGVTGEVMVFVATPDRGWRPERAAGTVPMMLNPEACSRAVSSRDPRFDGVFFVGITTTGIYCRPVCPARVSYPDRRRFFDSAAAAERSGFRPCLRCRPELAPGKALCDAVPRLARSAALRIAEGALNGQSVDALARELGVGGRQLRRAMERELGVSPVELAQTHRLLLAKCLLTDTRLPVTRVAYSSGFQSLRRFNSVFRERYRMSPSALRRGERRGPPRLRRRVRRVRGWFVSP
jgi:probable HAF family extracellular repeat protein